MKSVLSAGSLAAPRPAEKSPQPAFQQAAPVQKPAAAPQPQPQPQANVPRRIKSIDEQPQPSRFRQAAPAAAAAEDGEELDIPAFIRKKML
jgi:hypothetical protein